LQLSDVEIRLSIFATRRKYQMSSAALLDGYVDEPEASRQLKKHPRTLKRYRDQPNGLPHVKIGNRVLYRVEAVRGWLLARERRPNPQRAS
jgi:hypothetical protein